MEELKDLEMVEETLVPEVIDDEYIEETGGVSTMVKALAGAAGVIVTGLGIKKFGGKILGKVAPGVKTKLDTRKINKMEKTANKLGYTMVELEPEDFDSEIVEVEEK